MLVITEETSSFSFMFTRDRLSLASSLSFFSRSLEIDFLWLLKFHFTRDKFSLASLLCALAVLERLESQQD